VEAVGSDVVDWSVGERVMGIVGGGACAEKVLVPADQLLPVPDGMELVDAAAIPEAFMTAWDALLVQGELRPGETALIHAVGSGVGTAALQLGKRQGARVLGTSRTPGKLERCASLGLDKGVLGTGEWWKELLLFLGDERVNGVLDLVGGPTLEGNLRVLAHRGRVVVVGLLGGSRTEIPLHRLLALRGTVRGTVLRSRTGREKAELAQGFTEAVLPGFAAGELRPLIEDRIPMGEVGRAHSRMEANETFGKLVLHW
jgi:NADPH:quinone reductase-like Zn-dependent oxidoreductase